MPEVKRPGRRPFYIEFPADLLAAIERLAKSNRRSVKAEVVEGMRRYLKRPEVVPEPPPAPPKRPRGRPRKER